MAKQTSVPAIAVEANVRTGIEPLPAKRGDGRWSAPRPDIADNGRDPADPVAGSLTPGELPGNAIPAPTLPDEFGVTVPPAGTGASIALVAQSEPVAESEPVLVPAVSVPAPAMMVASPDEISVVDGGPMNQLDGGADPQAPVEAALSWAALAVARRESSGEAPAVAPAAARGTGEPPARGSVASEAAPGVGSEPAAGVDGQALSGALLSAFSGVGGQQLTEVLVSALLGTGGLGGDLSGVLTGAVAKLLTGADPATVVREALLEALVGAFSGTKTAGRPSATGRVAKPPIRAVTAPDGSDPAAALRPVRAARGIATTASRSASGTPRGGAAEPTTAVATTASRSASGTPRGGAAEPTTAVATAAVTAAAPVDPPADGTADNPNAGVLSGDGYNDTGYEGACTSGACDGGTGGLSGDGTDGGSGISGVNGGAGDTDGSAGLETGDGGAGASVSESAGDGVSGTSGGGDGSGSDASATAATVPQATATVVPQAAATVVPRAAATVPQAAATIDYYNQPVVAMPANPYNFDLSKLDLQRAAQIWIDEYGWDGGGDITTNWVSVRKYLLDQLRQPGSTSLWNYFPEVKERVNSGLVSVRATLETTLGELGGVAAEDVPGDLVDDLLILGIWGVGEYYYKGTAVEQVRTLLNLGSLYDYVEDVVLPYQWKKAGLGDPDVLGLKSGFAAVTAAVREVLTSPGVAEAVDYFMTHLQDDGSYKTAADGGEAFFGQTQGRSMNIFNKYKWLAPLAWPIAPSFYDGNIGVGSFISYQGYYPFKFVVANVLGVDVKVAVKGPLALFLELTEQQGNEVSYILKPQLSAQWFISSNGPNDVQNGTEWERRALDPGAVNPYFNERLKNLLSGIAGVLADPNWPGFGLDLGTTPRTNTLVGGTELREGDSLVSPDGAYTLIVQRDGNLVLYRATDDNASGLAAVWASGTSGCGDGGCRLTLQTDGNLVLYPGSANTDAKWASNFTFSSPSPVSDVSQLTLVLDNNGQLKTNCSCWRDTTYWDKVGPFGGGPTRNAPTGSTLYAGGALLKGEALTSPNGYFGLILQEDGNLVLYKKDSFAPGGKAVVWSTETYGQGVARAVLQTDRNFVLYTDGGTDPKWATDTKVTYGTNTGRLSYGAQQLRLQVQDDGRLVLYDTGTAIWNYTDSGVLRRDRTAVPLLWNDVASKLTTALQVLAPAAVQGALSTALQSDAGSAPLATLAGKLGYTFAQNFLTGTVPRTLVDDGVQTAVSLLTGNAELAVQYVANIVRVTAELNPIRVTAAPAGVQGTVQNAMTRLLSNASVTSQLRNAVNQTILTLGTNIQTRSDVADAVAKDVTAAVGDNELGGVLGGIVKSAVSDLLAKGAVTAALGASVGSEVLNFLNYTGQGSSVSYQVGLFAEDLIKSLIGNMNGAIDTFSSDGQRAGLIAAFLTIPEGPVVSLRSNSTIQGAVEASTKTVVSGVLSNKAAPADLVKFANSVVAQGLTNSVVQDWLWTWIGAEVSGLLGGVLGEPVAAVVGEQVAGVVAGALADPVVAGVLPELMTIAANDFLTAPVIAKLADAAGQLAEGVVAGGDVSAAVAGLVASLREDAVVGDAVGVAVAAVVRRLLEDSEMINVLAGVVTTLISGGALRPWGRTGFDSILGAPSRSVYAVGDTVYAATEYGLSISVDKGETWTTYTAANSGFGGTSVWGVYAVGDTVYAATNGGLSISTDNGANWTTYRDTDGLGSNLVWGVFAVGDTVYAATSDGLSISTDNGANWTTYTKDNRLGGNFVSGVYVVGDTVYAATDGGLSISADNGVSWTTYNRTNGLGGDVVQGVYVVGDTVYAATLGGGLSISYENLRGDGLSWTTSRFANNFVRGVYVFGGTVYVATEGGLAISGYGAADTLGGYDTSSWTTYTIANGLGNDLVNGVFAVGDTVYVATDGGVSVGPMIEGLLPQVVVQDALRSGIGVEVSGLLGGVLGESVAGLVVDVLAGPVVAGVLPELVDIVANDFLRYVGPTPGSDPPSVIEALADAAGVLAKNLVAGGDVNVAVVAAVESLRGDAVVVDAVGVAVPAVVKVLLGNSDLIDVAALAVTTLVGGLLISEEVGGLLGGMLGEQLALADP